MSISPVSFRASEDFQALISKPQAYQAAPAAASGLQYGAKTKKSHALRNTVVGAAVIGTTLAVLAKKGKLDYTGENTILQQASKYAKLVGNAIADYALKLKDKFFGTDKSKAFDYAAVVGDDRSAAAKEKLDKALAADKLAKAQKALKKATTDNAKAGIQRQIEKLSAIVNG